MVRVLVLAICLAASASLAAQDVEDKVDKRVKKLLDSRDINYEIDEDGDFKVTYSLENGRTQLAFVRSTTFDYGELKIREILSIGYRADGDEFPAAVANRMLEHSNDAKLGAWGKQGNLGIFTTRIPADAGAKELADAIEITISLADELEKEFTGDTDEF